MHVRQVPARKILSIMYSGELYPSICIGICVTPMRCAVDDCQPSLLVPFLSQCVTSPRFVFTAEQNLPVRFLHGR